jgi:phosphonate transport system substrate-binding protein
MVNSVMRKIHARGLFWGLFILLVYCLPFPATAQDPLILAVHPYLPFAELTDRYTPLADYLGNQLGRNVVVRIGRNYQDHMEYIGRDKVDIAILGPALYVALVDKYGGKPLLARLEIGGKPVFHGKIITGKGSPIASLADLKGKRFAFGDPESTMSHLVPRFMLLEAGVRADDLADYQFLGSHTNVALGVLAGDFDAGAVKEEVFYKFEQQGLQALATTSPFSEHVFVARGTLPTQTVEAVREALYQLKDTPEGQTILSRIKKRLTGMVPVQDSDYDNLRDILKTLHRHGIH